MQIVPIKDHTCGRRRHCLKLFYQEEKHNLIDTKSSNIFKCTLTGRIIIFYTSPCSQNVESMFEQHNLQWHEHIKHYTASNMSNIQRHIHINGLPQGYSLCFICLYVVGAWLNNIILSDMNMIIKHYLF